ncbi:TetR/AcrR family transcriptional regulator [Naumannella halotolerans]|uniref:AcrR family transcriptional regulator n=1 Tax=Naumannella halotolerans TaxID=993414 RepID=A0A4R7JAD7_9ACTN|nr:TetR/AcrR family transcriptional regulator [Naumannella halotolerans]TDT34520.1 AcrR family transcriptional regulator [Naumannella halotolerans]
MTAMADRAEFPPLDLHPFLLGALDEFARHGYDGTSVRTLAQRLGVTVPALYYYYENKQAMLVALLDHAMTTITHHIRTGLANSAPDSESRLASVVEALVLYFAHYPQLAAMDTERRSLDPKNLAAYIARRDEAEGYLRGVISDGVADGTFSTRWPYECTRAIFNMCQGIAGWYRMDGPVGPEEMAQRYVQLALAMLRYTERPD